MESGCEVRVEENGRNGHDGEQRITDEDQGDARGTLAPQNIPTVAKMPTDRYSSYYNMTHKKRGMAIIFNHETFDIHGLKPRNGTNVDCNNLKESLKGLGFQVSVFNNLVYKKVFEYISEAANANHTDHDCIMVCVLSHGELGMLYAKDHCYSPETLWDSFTADKCPTLAGKPKMFFIQACQGDKLDGGVVMRTTETDGPSSSHRIPIHADFLIGYSTVPGYYSWRNTTRGSWFIQALAEDLRLYGKERDLLTLLTFVSQRVAYDFESNTPDSPIMHQQKQIPCITTMMTRLLVFGNKN